jgi:hypothetical protein
MKAASANRVSAQAVTLAANCERQATEVAVERGGEGLDQASAMENELGLCPGTKGPQMPSP